ncbi:MAG: hypothetical protein KAT70_09255, partial [Thermoplasmata archaeon]|nr:hypothetical protein [Thermoplasmata archaeon]
LPGIAVLLGEGFEFGFYRATDIRFGLFSAGSEALRLPQYMIGYGTVFLAASMAYKERCSVGDGGIGACWERLRKNPWPVLCLMLAMLVNDMLEAFWFS